MRIIKSSLALLILSFAFMNFAFVGGVNAAEPFNPLEKACDEGAPGSEICADAAAAQVPGADPISGPEGVILRVANVLAIVAGIMAVVILIVVGIQYMLSGGDSSKLNANRNAIIYTLIGIVVIIVSRTIIVFVINGIN